MGVPAHDQRDLDFARKYLLPVDRVIAVQGQEDDPILTEAYTGSGHLVNSRFLNGMEVESAKQAVHNREEDEGWGRDPTIWRLRNWGVSSPVYWGPHIHTNTR